MGKKPKPNMRSVEWAEAKRRCRLSEEDVRMAKELGFAPRSLIKNIPSPSQPWKATVKDWIRGLYEKKMQKAAKKAQQQKADSPHVPAEPVEAAVVEDECVDGCLRAKRRSV
jgi:hypothetical protein